MSPDLASVFPAAALLGAGVGLVLGLTGAGGGIFAVPALVFGLGWGVPQAGPVALLAVGASAAVGSAQGLRAGLVRYRAAMLMAGIGVCVAPLGTWMAHRLPERWLVGLFAIAMLIVAARMYRASRGARARASTTGPSGAAAAPPPCRLDPATGRLHWTRRVAGTLGTIGAVSGFASGLLGVGGGFVIVPALRRFSDITVHGVVATSLFVIALISAGTVANAWWHGMHPGEQGWTFVVGAVAGMVLGRALAPRLAAARLQQVFSALMALVALGMFVRAFGA
ncbi:sulfite exporter TauE/SafE family protein [Pandoraea nosoerga]|uniref:Probable membrane transporter protein n=1 Tax=Pandoraea nosoerga TaxID=2508296 RepID=A0A5E4SFK1_9BURK|nr:sulfite exporter TauE/SafE family protein [Pandoraea nosoerga]MBN4665331.1 sulfite exporter TauE/SafE family protein [Pandoraea nosoerga]MBN4674731.1 sulfite exporter TauE/SafE family protein [Pandoraea nosoerga]MBN4680620.1 sulfite exporter TauE/SafE family protein [Pandoraea nosoerga]MBN4744025.1 sulfite exporter TauE/SafE family protein [Pandoraea nosoerga]VVD74430.1 membrane protein [Pandoraea nosoerga]